VRTKGHPLAPKNFLLRNAGKTLPLVAVIILAVMLIAGIVSLINSIPFSIRTIYDYSKRYTGVTPRGDATLSPLLKERIEKGAPVKLNRVMTCRASDSVVKSIVGKWPFVILGLNQDDMRYYLKEMGGEQIVGRLPKVKEAGAVVSEPLARNLGLKIGDDLLGPDKLEGYSPNKVKVVGIAQTQRWLAIVPIEYHQAYHFPPIDVLAAFAEDPRDQKKLDDWIEKEFDGERARVYSYGLLEKDTSQMFNILYKVLNVVIGTLVVVITFMMGMLMNIYQRQRIQEFGLLQALGYTKAFLLRRVIVESVVVVLFGWVAGVAIAFGLLNLTKKILMDPSAFALNVLDPVAYLYTVPAPIAILGVAWFTVHRTFRSFDPVGIVERRLV